MSDYLNQINPKRTNPVIESILQEANMLGTPIIRIDAINFIIQLIKAANIKKVLEIGSAIGYSSIMIATFTDAEVITIEKNEENYKRALKNIRNAKLESKIKLILADANEYNLSEDDQFDLLFIDASKSSYIRFFEKYESHLNEHGIIITDNLLFHGFVESPESIISRNKKQLVRKINNFNEYIVNHPDYDTYIYQIGDGLSLSIRKV
ncbi:O-methyltransferase [Candidatus Izemoplasma sp. B36]|uniref:O-methyltransferase n=1 Tax=Candidatus Izemoplasma sp. B36 TaxID=3242468 RepID=UPI0035591BEC